MKEKIAKEDEGVALLTAVDAPEFPEKDMYTRSSFFVSEKSLWCVPFVWCGGFFFRSVVELLKCVILKT